MIAVYLSPIYLAVCLYLLLRLLSWMKSCHDWAGKRVVQAGVVVIYTFLALSILIAFFMPSSSAQRVLKLISNYWLGILLYILLTVGSADLLRLILKRISFPKKEKLFSRAGHALVGGICVAVIVSFSAVGIWGAAHVKSTEYEVTIHKKAGKLNSLKVVLAADLHLGYNVGVWHMKQMVEQINAQRPDVVVIAGDIFDNEYEALDDPEKLQEILSSIDSTYGVYACYGNHDIDEKILAGFTFEQKGKKQSDIRMDKFLKKCNIKLLRDEAVLIEDAFYLYGRPDYERPGRGIEKRKTPEEITEELDKSKPILVLDHEPRELRELAEAGVDLDLCGHTHDGQMFPGNLITSLSWENSCGYLKKGEMHNIVTSGVGVFGPNMRVGTKSEICGVEVRFLPE